MPRVKLDLPTHFHFITEIPVRIDDVNYGGHLGNDSLQTLMHEARVRFLLHYNYTEMNVEGAGTIMSDAIIVYKAEAFHGDVLQFELAVVDIRDFACDIVYRVTNKDSGKEIARAKTGIVFFDYTERKVARVPDGFRKHFSSAESSIRHPDNPQIGVGAVVIKDGRVLLVKRATPPSQGLWAIPGGRLEFGETLQEAAEREILEETGITIRASEPVFTFDVIDRDTKGMIQFHYVIVDLKAEYISGEPTPGDDVTEARWIGSEELDTLDVSDKTVELLRNVLQF